MHLASQHERFHLNMLSNAKSQTAFFAKIRCTFNSFRLYQQENQTSFLTKKVIQRFFFILSLIVIQLPNLQKLQYVTPKHSEKFRQIARKTYCGLCTSKLTSTLLIQLPLL